MVSHFITTTSPSLSLSFIITLFFSLSQATTRTHHPCSAFNGTITFVVPLCLFWSMHAHAHPLTLLHTRTPQHSHTSTRPQPNELKCRHTLTDWQTRPFPFHERNFFALGYLSLFLSFSLSLPLSLSFSPSPPSLARSLLMIKILFAALFWLVLRITMHEKINFLPKQKNLFIQLWMRSKTILEKNNIKLFFGAKSFQSHLMLSKNNHF